MDSINQDDNYWRQFSTMFNKQNKTLAFLILLTAITSLPNAYSHKLFSLSDSQPKFDRNQSMLINLKSAPMSAGYYLINSCRTSREMSHDLDRAFNQVMEVDKTYAQSRHKPDSRYLENVCLKITLARQTADELQVQLKEAYVELKSSIEETLITDTKFK